MFKPNKIYLVDKEPTKEELQNFTFPVIFRIMEKNGKSYDITYNAKGVRSVLIDTDTIPEAPIDLTQFKLEINGKIENIENLITDLDAANRLENLEGIVNNLGNINRNNLIVSTEPPHGISNEGTEWIMYSE